ncbi:MAG: YihY/virulence factor BrkB family protein [Pirellulales bacterium]|nr:YihY/virulence factor BrkB family protein [Pirellulales bacterium]
MNILQRFGRRLWRAHLGFQDHEGTLSAAGIAYYLALSFFPLLLVLVAGLGSVLAWTQAGQEAQHELLVAIGQQASPDLAQQVEHMLNAVTQRASASGPIGFIALLVSAIAIFAQLDAAFDRIWRLPADLHVKWRDWIARLIYQRLKALAMLLGVGGFIVLVMVTGMVWSGVEQALEPKVSIGPWFHWASSLWINLLLNWTAFAMIFRVVPKVRIRWWDSLRGGLLAAVLWEAGRQALAAYMLRLNYPSAYGIIGSFIAVMLWAYYAALVVLFGAEYVRVIGEERQGQKELPLEG